LASLKALSAQPSTPRRRFTAWRDPLTLELVPDGISECAQALLEAAHCLALGLGGQAGVTWGWGVGLAVLEQLDGTTHQAATILLKDPDLGEAWQ
jgi:hypothetical protein